MKSILDPSFHYTSSGQTDIRKTFERVSRELRVREGPERTSISEHNRHRAVRILPGATRTALDKT
jgi:hypothetical protein